jgi:predicted dehydrogenase
VSYEALLERDLDGVVIATPSAGHAGQAIAALERGLAVFCQKPLARTGEEARSVVAAARAADRLLDVDLCYRRTAAMGAIRPLVAGGGGGGGGGGGAEAAGAALGRVYAVDVTFHNAWGPDGAWFYDPARSGGGCLMDLGIHLVDLALWTLGFPAVEGVSSRLYHEGRRVTRADGVAEDHAVATLSLAGDVVVRLACSWNLHAGRDAVIEAVFHGTEGGAALRNVGGSFYDFVAERYRGTATERLAEPPDGWGGRTIQAWAERLARDPGYDPAVEEVVAVAEVLDRLYDAA